MVTWTCPNHRCTYDQELQSGQRCPLCGRDAKAFDFGEFGNLLKEKWSSKESKERNKEIKRVSERITYCPTCGSTNMFWASGLPQLWSLWECRECGYKGALVLEDGKLAEKLRKEWGKKHREGARKG
jgi:predicted RNA-binding Zn-ribbon protein involved in translation (DUF1610 family)